MRRKRIKLEGLAHYHVMSQIVDSGVRMDEDEMHRFQKTMRRAEAFSGVRILTYVLMRNHFHILVEVPRRQVVSDDEVVARMRMLYTEEQMKEFDAQWDLWRVQGLERLVAEALDRQRLRMYDVSEFMKTLKQRITMSYNVRHKRLGGLWIERFKSVLVEGREEALAIMAAYIDLNPVRAGLVEDPKDYRFSGYGEAMGGSRRALAGLAGVLDNSFGGAVAGDILARYRMHVYQCGAALEAAFPGQIARPGLDRDAVNKVLESNGKLNLGVVLLCRARYFTDGVVLGSRTFVQDALAHRNSISKVVGKTTARALEKLEGTALHIGCCLHRAPVTLPDLE